MLYLQIVAADGVKYGQLMDSAARADAAGLDATGIYVAADTLLAKFAPHYGVYDPQYPTSNSSFFPAFTDAGNVGVGVFFGAAHSANQEIGLDDALQIFGQANLREGGGDQSQIFGNSAHGLSSIVQGYQLASNGQIAYVNSPDPTGGATLGELPLTVTPRENQGITTPIGPYGSLIGSNPYGVLGDNPYGSLIGSNPYGSLTGYNPYGTLAGAGVSPYSYAPAGGVLPYGTAGSLDQSDFGDLTSSPTALGGQGSEITTQGALAVNPSQQSAINGQLCLLQTRSRLGRKSGQQGEVVREL